MQRNYTSYASVPYHSCLPYLLKRQVMSTISFFHHHRNQTLIRLTSKYNNGTATTPIHEAAMKPISVFENLSNSSSRTYTRLRGSSISRSSSSDSGILESKVGDRCNLSSSGRTGVIECLGEISTGISVIDERTEDGPCSEERRGIEGVVIKRSTLRTNFKMCLN